MRTHVQRINAGHNFGGVAPTTTPTRHNDIEKDYPVDDVGGLFEFSVENPMLIRQIELSLGGQASWTLTKKCKDATEVLLWAGTTDAYFVTLATDTFVIQECEQILLRTVGAATAMRAAIIVEDADASEG